MFKVGDKVMVKRSGFYVKATITGFGKRAKMPSKFPIDVVYEDGTENSYVENSDSVVLEEIFNSPLYKLMQEKE